MSYFINIIYWRIQRNLSEIQLARKASISKAYVTQLEKGTRNNLTLKKLEQIAEALEINMNDLIIDCRTCIYKDNCDWYKENIKLEQS